MNRVVRRHLRGPWTAGFLGLCCLASPACGKAVEGSSPPPATPDGGGGGGASAGEGGSQLGGSAGAAQGGKGGDGGAAAGGAAGADAGCSACDAYGNPEVSGSVAQDALSELSGIVESSKHPGVFFAHNDSGDSARFFAFDLAGKPRGEFVLEGAAAADWEDLAIGPCPAGTCLFVGDFGDNSAVRESIRIYRVVEPDALPTSTVTPVAVLYQEFRYNYADGPQNAETLLAHPGTGDLYIISKEGTGPSGVYRIAAPTSPSVAPQVLARTAELTMPSGSNETTAGAIHPCGDRFLLRTYNRLWEYRTTTADFSSAFLAAPTSLPVAVETQGEAVAYRSNGAGYVTVSEGDHPELHVVACK